MREAFSHVSLWPAYDQTARQASPGAQVRVCTDHFWLLPPISQAWETLRGCDLHPPWLTCTLPVCKRNTLRGEDVQSVTNSSQ